MGSAVTTSIWRVAPGAIWFWAPFVLGLVGAIPLAMLSAHPPLGRLLGAAGLCRVPEESGRLEGAAGTGLFAPFANERPAAAAHK